MSTLGWGGGGILFTSSALLHSLKLPPFFFNNRHSFKSHPSEVNFIHARSRHIVESKVFAELMQAGLHCRSNTSTVDVEDVPTVAIGGSGGGHRAMFGFMASLHALQSKGWLEATHWLAGVSGSCWTIASLYTIGHFNVGKLIRHCKSVAQEGIHPMSRQALDAVARSSKGVYFLLAPLLSKVQSGVVGIGVMVSRAARGGGGAAATATDAGHLLLGHVCHVDHLLSAAQPLRPCSPSPLPLHVSVLKDVGSHEVVRGASTVANIYCRSSAASRWEDRGGGQEEKAG